MLRRDAWLGLGLALGLAACGDPAADPVVLELLDFHQAGAEGVFLNEELVLHFSRPLDRSSVTHASVAILDRRGEPVAGALQVDGARVTFAPRLPRQASLSDGGFVPSSTYTVAVRGFPSPDGVRGREGEPLRTSRRFSFRTTDFSGAMEDPVFAPPLVEAPPYLRLVTPEVGPVDGIVLSCEEALDPRSLHDGLFELLDGTTPLSLRIALIENSADGAMIELRALGEGREKLRALEPGAWYVLRVTDAEAPRNLGGIPVQPGWFASRLGGARIAVVGPRLRTRRVEFDAQDELWSVQPVAGVDGSAIWGDGRLAIRYPAAAGTGEAGSVALGELGEAELRDVHAAQLELAADRTVELPSEGLVILRSQGSMTLAGALRRSPSAEPAPPMAFPAGESLSEWLARAKQEDPAWTVLIAGGDLNVDLALDDAGGIDLAGPLLLVAGGRLRIGDALRSDASWKLAPGDGWGFADPPLRWVPTAIDPELAPEDRFRVDEPAENPLARPLLFGIQSASFRPAAGVAAWRPGRFEAADGAGEARVRWIGQRFTQDGFEEYGPVDDVLLLAGSDALRFTVELLVPAEGGKWDPPTVEYVEFRWDEPRLGETQRSR